MVHSAERLAPTVDAIQQEFIETLVAVQETNLEFGSRLDFYLALSYCWM